MKAKKAQIKINLPLPGHPVDSTVLVDVDGNGIPLSKFWRDRLHDAETDGCVTVVRQYPPKAKSKTINKDKEKTS